MIPTFERVQQTLRAVESALAQSRPPDEVLVVDDGSSERTQAHLSAVLENYPVRLDLIPHTGHPGRVRNAGLGSVSGTHVAFLDSDDEWLPEKLARQAELLEAGARASFTNALCYSPAGETLAFPTSAFKSRVNLDDLLTGNVIFNSSAVVSRDLLERIGRIPDSYSLRGIEDYAAWLRVATFTDWHGISEPLIRYHDFPDGSIRATKGREISEQTLVQLDYVSWRGEQGAPVRGAGYLLTRTLPWLVRRSRVRLT